MILYANGSYDAFNELYRRYADRVYRYFLSKTRSDVESDELIQLLFLKMHSSKHLFDQKYLFEQWLFIIARTTMLDFFRKKKSQQKILETDLTEFQEFHQSFNTDEMSISEDPLRSLNEKEKQMIKMRYEDELSFKEISHILSQSEVSLRKFLSRTIKKLRTHGANS